MRKGIVKILKDYISFFLLFLIFIIFIINVKFNTMEIKDFYLSNSNTFDTDEYYFIDKNQFDYLENYFQEIVKHKNHEQIAQDCKRMLDRLEFDYINLKRDTLIYNYLGNLVGSKKLIYLYFNLMKKKLKLLLEKPTLIPINLEYKSFYHEMHSNDKYSLEFSDFYFYLSTYSKFSLLKINRYLWFLPRSFSPSIGLNNYLRNSGIINYSILKLGDNDYFGALALDSNIPRIDPSQLRIKLIKFRTEFQDVISTNDSLFIEEFEKSKANDEYLFVKSLN